MTSELPTAIRNYFAGKNARDFAVAASGFAPTAVVKDEGHDHIGPDAIRAWMAETAAKYDDKAEVLGAAQSGKRTDVTARISGNFPGSPIELHFLFDLEDGLITHLHIRA